MSENLRAAIVQDDATGRVLMLGWMDEEALALTKSSGYVHFFSRSRQQLPEPVPVVPCSRLRTETLPVQRPGTLREVISC